MDNKRVNDKIIIESIINTDIEIMHEIGNSIYTSEVMSFINFIKLYDMFENTIHFEVITCIYLDKDSSKLSYEAQAKRLNIDTKTLFNYRKKYMEFYKKICNRENSCRKTDPSGKSFPTTFQKE